MNEQPKEIEKPECQACGSDDYEGELKYCPWCGGSKCSHCDMGDNCCCASCEND